MATGRIDLHPLPPFDPLSEPNSIAPRWSTWKKRFETYLAALGIKDNAQKRALLLYQAGESTQEIFETLANTGDTNDYTTALTKLDAYFSPKKNLDFEIFKFRTTVQTAGQTLDQYATCLRKLAATCDFPEINHEIKSVLIQNCLSKRLRRFALLETDLTLEKLLAKGRAFEISEAQATGIEESLSSTHISDSAVNMVTNRRRQSTSRFARDNSHRNSTNPTKSVCRNCGGNWPHNTNPCPARGKDCRKCGKLNHFAKCCRSSSNKQPQKIQANSPHRPQNVRHVATRATDFSDADEYLFTVTTDNKTTPKASVKINDVPIDMVVDTGAAIDIIDESTLAKIQKSATITLKPSNARLFAYGAASNLKLLGQFEARVESKNRVSVSTIHAVPGNYGCLLSYKTASSLGLVTVDVHTVQPQISQHETLIAEFPNIFDGIGQLKDHAVKLHIDNNVTPIAQPPRKIPFHMRQQVTAALEKLELQGIIEKVDGPTPWISPLVVIPKKDGDVRICVDMRMANRAILRERHPTPTVDDLVHTLNGAKVFSKLDLRSGYHQLLLDAESRYITTFQTHKGLRRYRTLNFGTSSASEIFQNVIAEQLRDIPHTLNISDDVIVFGANQKEHDDALRQVFQRFSSRGLTLNKEKCEFNKDQLTFFGFVFSAKGISADPIKVEAIKSAPAPTTQSGLRSFLGMATYCSKFIKNFSDLTHPLRELIKKNTPFQWKTEHEHAFDEVKSALTSSTVMSYFDNSKRTELVTDASPFGLSAILSQFTPGKQDRKIVAYISRSLSDVEQRYSQTEREALAIVWAMEKLHLYLSGGKFTLLTDCKPIQMILHNPASRPPARIERWYLRVQDFDFDVVYLKGTANPSDFLSHHLQARPNVNNIQFENIAEQYVNFLTEHAVPKAMSLSEIQHATSTDATLQRLVEIIRNNSWHELSKMTHSGEVDIAELKLYSKLKDELTINDKHNVILRGSRLILPSSIRAKAIEIAHEGHQGLVKTKRLLRTKVWFPQIDKQVGERISRCVPCHAVGQDSRPEPLKMNALPPSPWHTVHIDFCGPFPDGQYLLVVIDAYSKFPEVDFVNSTSASATLPKLERIFATHGIPHFVRSDNGPPFPGREFYNFMKEIGANHRPSIPLSPQGNGQVENFMKPLEKSIRTAVAENKNWKRDIFKFLMNYRATPHSTTGKSPSQLLFNRQICTKLPEVFSEIHENIDENLREKDGKAKSQMKENADRARRAKPSDLKSGDTVLVRQKKVNKLSTNFCPKPYRVTERKGSRVTVSRNGHFITRNVSHFKVLPDDKVYMDNGGTEEICLDFGDDHDDAIPDQEEQPQVRYPIRSRQPVHRYGNNIYCT